MPWTPSKVENKITRLKNRFDSRHCFGVPQSVTAITFDTLKFTRKLESGGISQEHARVIAEAVADVQAETSNAVATKNDLEKLRLELEHKIEKLGMTLTIKMGGMMIAAVGLMFRYLPPH
jgi:hypothetical protein